MSMDAITIVTKAEEAARQLKAEAAAQAKTLLAETETEGRAAVETALKKAAAVLEAGRKLAVDEAEKVTQELRADTETKKSALRTRAEARLEQASDMIVERIVGR